MTAPLVDPAALTAWATGHLPGDGPVEVERLQAGHSNLTFVLATRRARAGPVGMVGVHHTSYEQTVAELGVLLGLAAA